MKQKKGTSKKVLIIQHAPHEHAASIRRALECQGIPTQYIHPYYGEKYPPAESLLGVISLGGPMSANDVENNSWIKDECKLLRQCVKNQIPLAGICLGGQILAKALGATVRKNKNSEIGWFPIEVTDEGRKDRIIGAAGPDPLVYHWHHDTFELPKDAVLLARSENCERQAFRLEENAYGFQFHPEADHQMLHEWLSGEGVEEEIQTVRKNEGAKTIQTADQQRKQAIIGERTSSRIAAALGQLFKIRDYSPVESEMIEQMETLAASSRRVLLEIGPPTDTVDDPILRMTGHVGMLLTIPDGEFLIFKENNGLLWPVRLDHVQRLTLIEK